MPNTYTKISSVTVGVLGAATIDFTSIPSTYTDLVVKLSGRGTDLSNRVVPYFRFNGSSTGYSAIRLYGQDASTTGSAANEGGTTAIFSNRMPAGTATSNTFGSLEFYIPNYAGSTNKSSSSESAAENNSTTSWNLSMVAGLWSNTAAITSISIAADVGNFAQYSTAVLYGINKS